MAASSAGVAPGDEEPDCSTLRAQGAAPTPSYSANMRVLMDSWNYQNLLPSRIGAVWDQVDNDMNNSPVVTTNVRFILYKFSTIVRLCNPTVDPAVQHSMPTNCPSVWVQCWCTGQLADNYISFT